MEREGRNVKVRKGEIPALEWYVVDMNTEANYFQFIFIVLTINTL